MTNLLLLPLLLVSLFLSPPCSYASPSATITTVSGDEVLGDCYDVDIWDITYYPDDYSLEYCNHHDLYFNYGVKGSDTSDLVGYVNDYLPDFGDDASLLLRVHLFLLLGCGDDLDECGLKVEDYSNGGGRVTTDCGSCRLEGRTVIMEDCGDLGDLFAAKSVVVGSQDYVTQFFPLADSNCDENDQTDTADADADGSLTLTFDATMTFTFAWSSRGNDQSGAGYHRILQY